MEADAEHLPFDDGDFDTVLSCVGVMFAPFHQLVADELVRVTRPGGRIALVNWTPTGCIGQIFAVMKSYVPPPPAGAQPGPLWGTEDHVRTLLGDRVTDLQARPHLLTVEQFENAESFRDFWTSSRSTTARLSLLIATSRMTRTAASGSIRTSPISPDVTVLTTAS